MTVSAVSAAAPGLDVPDEGAAAPSRRERKAASTRRAIVRSARELFEEHGYSETTVDQIAEHADVAPRTFFRYFATKEALLFADFDEERQSMLESLEARPVDEDPVTSIAIVLDHFAQVLVERRDELAWGFRVCSEQDAQELYERSMLKRQTNVRIAEFVAQRLGVDVETDPRPTAWAMAVMGVFGSVLKVATAEAPDATEVPTAGAVRTSLVSTLRDSASTMLQLTRTLEQLPPH
ncbi:MAG: TetR family transcriptional regulator [Microthrixaceae bacterium]